VWRGGFWAARPETRFARKAGAVRVASETPELDEKEALRGVAIALLLSRQSDRRVAHQDAAKWFRPTSTLQPVVCEPLGPVGSAVRLLGRAADRGARRDAKAGL
jgi:hypothetical protein